MDDAATLSGGPFVVTTDTLVESVHFLADDPPADIAWKLVATNLSDLAAKGARPVGILLNYPLSDEAWDHVFLAGLEAVLRAQTCPLIGGDTVTLPAGAPRILTVTAIGTDACAPPRSGACAGDLLWVTGTIGDAGAGLSIALAGGDAPAALLAAYRRPVPRLADGRVLAPQVHAMMDVSDGVLIDAARMAAASGLRVEIDLAAIPLSTELVAHDGDDRAARLRAATAGDDYELLFALPAGIEPAAPATRVGRFDAGAGLSLVDAGAPVPLPPRLGYEHPAR